MEWTGFSDEDLRRLKKTSNDGEGGVAAKLQTSRLKSEDSRKGSRPRKPSKVVTFANDVETEPLSINQKLAPSNQTGSGPPQTTQPSRLTSSSVSDNAANDAKASRDSPGTVNGTGPKQGAGTAASGEVSVCDEDVKKAATEVDGQEFSMDLDEKSILMRELGSLEKFRDQQKMMEELNRRKKQMLTTAIQQRQHKAKAEAVKLTKIKQELDHLDQLLSVDVSIIRNKIETASREYFEAQKRYDRAELEFIEAKTDLHQKCESKDLLTEHLYTVIHQNELRKSQKLAELMRKLELETGDVFSDELSASAILPVPICLSMPPVRSSTQHVRQPSPTSPSPPVADGGHSTAAVNNSCTEHMSSQDTCSPTAILNNSSCEETSTAVDTKTASNNGPLNKECAEKVNEDL